MICSGVAAAQKKHLRPTAISPAAAAPCARSPTEALPWARLGAFPPVGGLDWWFGGLVVKEGFRMYPLQKPGGSKPKSRTNPKHQLGGT